MSDEGNDRLEIGVNVNCAIEAAKVAAFVELLRELAALVGAKEIESLEKVFIVQDEDVADAVNTLIKSVSDTASYSPNPAYTAPAVAVPVETKDGLACFIVMAASLLQPLNPERYHSYEIVTSLLEELLHVWVYTAAWERRGYVQHLRSNLDGCHTEILTIASMMCDEYVVNRKKSRLLATLSIIDAQEGNGSVIAILSYGQDVGSLISLGAAELKQLVLEAAKGAIAAPEVWAQILTVLYRRFFEPLSRDAAYSDSIPDGSSADQRLQSHAFYRDVIAQKWREIHDELKQVFDSELADTETALDEISRILRNFLSFVGVTYQETENGECLIVIVSAFFDKQLES